MSILDIKKIIRSQLPKHRFWWEMGQNPLPHDRNDESLKSSFFPLDVSSETRWRLHFAVKKVDNRKAIGSLKLELLKSGTKFVTAEFTCSIINSSNREINKKFQICDFQQNDIKGFDEFMVLEHDKNIVSPSGKFTLFCEVTEHLNSGNKTVSRFPCKIPESVIDVIASLPEDSEFDVTLCCGGIELQAHKSVLASQSSVFKEMFSSDTQETNQNRVDITDIEPETLGKLLRCIYVKPDLTPEIAKELLPPSGKYAFSGIKAMCEAVISQNLSIETAAEALVLADKHNAQQLKENALNFIYDFPTEVMLTESWKSMVSERPKLLEDCFKKLSSTEPTNTFQKFVNNNSEPSV